MPGKQQRIRDPLHDIIAFNDGEFERTMWNVVQTQPFQRLRRVRQLGFSEFTFPGATHTRFTHSLGVFHTARQLMKVIQAKTPSGDFSYSKANTALAAALVHDVGHGMFSHAFEKVAKELNLEMARHTRVSEYLIRKSQISKALEEGGVHVDNVATLIGRKGPGDLYDAVVSSQFDADRLDYMRRDRLMSGVQSGGIDFTWLIENLEIGDVFSSAGEIERDSDKRPGKVPTFVIGPKAIMAAEAYVLALFQLYPTVYFHKTTVAAELVFKALMVKVFGYLVNESLGKTGLPKSHPFVRLAKNPSDMNIVLELDDTVFWGALPFFQDAECNEVSFLAKCLRNRQLPKLPKSSDVGLHVQQHINQNMSQAKPDEIERFWTKSTFIIENRFKEWCVENSNGRHPRILFDSQERDPYSANENRGKLNQIHVANSDGNVTDIRELSPMINALEPFRFVRAYTFDEDHDAAKFVSDTIQEMLNSAASEQNA